MSEHRDETPIAIQGESFIFRFAANPSTVRSFNPTFKTVSIIPGIDARAPERTETSNGFAGSPNRMPIERSTFFKACNASSQRPGGYIFLRR